MLAVTAGARMCPTRTGGPGGGGSLLLATAGGLPGACGAYGWPVGTIYYGGSETPIHIDDRALAHLKVVIATKLRRSESFTVSWRHPNDQPRGRSTIWLHPSIPLRFVFDDPEPAELSRAWIEELATSANSSGGIMLVAEFFDGAPNEDRPGSRSRHSVGRVEVADLAIDTLTVAGNDVPVRDETAGHDVLQADESPTLVTQ